jgi:Fe2+ transport system protein FeoA
MTKITLHDIQAGQSAVILSIPDIDVATQAMRMGIAEGEWVTCVAKIPAGPTVLQHCGMELAIGQQLCQEIEVQLS